MASRFGELSPGRCGPGAASNYGFGKVVKRNCFFVFPSNPEGRNPDFWLLSSISAEEVFGLYFRAQSEKHILVYHFTGKMKKSRAKRAKKNLEVFFRKKYSFEGKSV